MAKAICLLNQKNKKNMETRKKVSTLLLACNKVAASNNYKGPANFVKISTLHKESIKDYIKGGVFGGTMKVITEDTMNDEALLGRDDDDYSIIIKLL